MRALAETRVHVSGSPNKIAQGQLNEIFRRSAGCKVITGAELADRKATLNAGVCRPRRDAKYHDFEEKAVEELRSLGFAVEAEKGVPYQEFYPSEQKKG